MRMVLLLAGMILSLAAQPQEIYKWVDKDGVVHYSDQPNSPNAKPVTLTGLSTYQVEQPGAATDAEEAQEPAGAAYSSLNIVQPAPDQTFFNADAVVSVVVELDAPLRAGDSVAFFLDGNRVADSDGLSTELSNLNRGSHFLRAAVVDLNGSPVITSQQIMIHVRQPSIQAPQNQPRPTPRPAPAG